MQEKNYQLINYKRAAFGRNFSEIHLVTGNNLNEIIKLKEDCKKGSNKEFYERIESALKGKNIKIEGNKFLKEVSIYGSDLCEQENYIDNFMLNATIRTLNPATKCFRDYDVSFIFDGITAKTVLVKGNNDVMKFTAFEEIRSLTALVNNSKIDLKATNCPYIKEIVNSDGSLTLYPLAFYYDFSISNENLDINNFTPKIDFNRFYDLLGDLNFDKLNLTFY